MKSVKFATDREAIVPFFVQIWKNSSDLLKNLNFATAEFDPKEKRVVAQTLGDVMWYVAGFATLYRLSLNGIAEENVSKTRSMFMPEEERTRTPLYDCGFPILEQFPRKFDVVFAPPPSDPEQTIMLINGMRVGDPLKDNAYNPGKDAEGKEKDKNGTDSPTPVEIDRY